MSFAKLQLSLAGVIAATVAFGFISAHGAGSAIPPPGDPNSAGARCYVNCTSGSGALGCRFCAHACGLPRTFSKSCTN